MKVSELIKYLSQFNPNATVGCYDIGQDSGDWYEIQFNDIVIKLP